MSLEYINRRKQKYFLHQGQTKSGKAKYYFSMKYDDACLAKIPKGYEIYENPDAQVFLCIKKEKLITNAEKQTVVSAVKNNKNVKHFIVDVKGKYISIYLAQSLLGSNNTVHDWIFQTIEANALKYLNFMAVMRFKLEDPIERYFTAERFCSLGSIDDWIQIGDIDHLGKLSVTTRPLLVSQRKNIF